MASHGRYRGAKSGFMAASKQSSVSGGQAVMLKQARKSGQLNLSNRSLTEGVTRKIL